MSNPVQVLQANVNKDAMPRNYHELTHVTIAKGITPAQLNAAYTLISNFGLGPKIRPVDFLIVVNSDAIAALTDIRLSTLDSTPVDIATIAQSDLTSGSKHAPVSSTVTLGAGFGANGVAGSGIQLRKTGSTATGSFTVDVIFRYDLRG